MAKSSGKSGVIIEIGNDWLKIGLAEPGKGKVSFSKMSLSKIVSPSSGVAEIIKGIYKKERFPKSPVRAIIPAQFVNIRMLEMPSTDPEEIRDMIDFQAAKQTPYSKDEIIFDYRMLGSFREGFTRVMLVIVQRSVLRQRYSIFEEAGLDVEQMTVSTEGLLSCCARAGSPGTTAFLDVDSFYSELLILSGGIPVFTRSILTGANHLAEDFDKSSAKLASEVKRSLEAFHGESDSEVGSLLVSGAGIKIEGLPDALAENLDVKVQALDFMQRVKKTGKVSMAQPAYNAVSLTALTGAGMAPDEMNFNLVPESVKMRESLVTKAKALTSLGFLTIAAFAAISVYTTSRVAFLEDRLDRFDAEKTRTTPMAERIKEQKEITRVVKDRSNPDFAAVNLLNAVHVAAPAGVIISDLRISTENNKLTIKGSAGHRRDINAYIKMLERSPLFIHVKTISKTVTDRETEQQLFEIGGTLEKKNDS